MTEAETESLAKRYIRYLGIESSTKDAFTTDAFTPIFNILVGGFMFTSYSGFLFGGNAIPGTGGFREKSYNELAPDSFDPYKRILEYSSAEELDFKLSAMGF